MLQDFVLRDAKAGFQAVEQPLVPGHDRLATDVRAIERAGAVHVKLDVSMERSGDRTD